MNRALLILLLLLLPLGNALAQSFAYVTNASSSSVSVINTATNTVTATVAVGFSPRGVAVSPDGSRAYVANTNSDSVSVIDTANNTVIATVTVGGLPVGIVVAPNGSRVYVANNFSGNVSVIDTATNTVTATVPVGAFPRRVGISPDGSRVYVTRGLNAVSVINTTNNTVIATVTVSDRPEGLAVSPDGSRLYVARFNNDTVSVIDTATNTVTATLAAGDGPYGVAITPDGSRVYVANQNTNSVSIIDTATNAVSTVTVGSGASGVAVTPDGIRAYVTNRDDGTVSAINTATNAVIGSAITVGSQPWSIAIGTPAVSTPTGIDISASAPAPVRYAAEINATPTTPVTLANPAGDINLSTALRYSFTQGEVRYARIECPAHVSFAAGSTVVASDVVATSLGAVNGLGSSVITFSITALTGGLTGVDTISVTGDRQITSTTAADCNFALYDFPSQAQAGGAAGRVVAVTGAYLAFAPSFALRVDAQGRAVADVEAVDGPYTRFVNEAPTNDATRGQLGGFSYDTAASVLGTAQPLSPAGVPITLADLMDSATALVFEGDFGAASTVFLSNFASCATVVATADSVDLFAAEFIVGSGSALGRFLCYEAGNGEIQAASYTVALRPVAASSNYVVSGVGPEALGEITRNGTELLAPLVQMAGGFTSRVVLTNTGSEKRQFTMRLLSAESGSPSEPGSTYIGLTSSDGAIPAGGTLILNLRDVFPLDRFQGPARGSIRVIVAASNRDIQGLYQIVNPSTGAISNHVMVRPGTN